MVEINKIEGSVINENGCSIFSGLKVEKDGKTEYIDYPYTYSLKNNVVLLQGSKGNTVSWFNDEYSISALRAFKFATKEEIELETLTFNQLVNSDTKIVPLPSFYDPNTLIFVSGVKKINGLDYSIIGQNIEFVKYIRTGTILEFIKINAI